MCVNRTAFNVCLLMDRDIANSRNICQTRWTWTRFAFDRYAPIYSVVSMRNTHFPLLVEIQYSVVLAMLYVGYSPAQIPSNMVIASQISFTFGSPYLKDIFCRLLTMSPGLPRIVFVNSRRINLNVSRQALHLYWIMCYFMGFNKFISWSAYKNSFWKFKY